VLLGRQTNQAKYNGVFKNWIGEIRRHFRCPRNSEQGVPGTLRRAESIWTGLRSIRSGMTREFPPWTVLVSLAHNGIRGTQGLDATPFTSREVTSMDDMEKTLFDLFGTLRQELSGEQGVGISLKAEGPTFMLRVRSQENPGDQKQPYFALVIEPEQEAFRISYDPHGVPPAKSEVKIVDRGLAESLPSLVRGCVEKERKRLMEYRQRG
jgi:hypothetical protein